MQVLNAKRINRSALQAHIMRYRAVYQDNLQRFLTAEDETARQEAHQVLVAAVGEIWFGETVLKKGFLVF